MNALIQAIFGFCETHDLSLDKPKQPRKTRVDYIIRGDNGKGIGVVIKNWARSVGVDIVIRAERAMKDSTLLKGVMIITNGYSDPAKQLADRINVGLYTQFDMTETDVIKKIIEEVHHEHTERNRLR